MCEIFLLFRGCGRGKNVLVFFFRVWFVWRCLVFVGVRGGFNEWYVIGVWDVLRGRWFDLYVRCLCINYFWKLFGVSIILFVIWYEWLVLYGVFNVY